jgi:hypothetical protein
MTYDIDLLKNNNNAQITGFDFRESGSLVSGRAKVVKRFIQLLYTIQGSDKTDLNAGCHLLDDTVGFNMEASAIDVAVQTAVNLCYRQIQSGQPENIPAVEKLERVELLKTEIDLDHCDITLDFTFADTVSVSVPVTLDYNNA